GRKSANRWAAATMLGALCFIGLAGVRFGGARQAFNWLPFIGALNNNWQASLSILLGKLYEYGAAIWLLACSGLPLIRASLYVAIMLGAIEAAQMHAPGHVAEITDPILALLLGAGFAALRKTRPLRDTILRKA
ncbi:MAG: hypothetical protein KGN84_00915, partial [Acidobacteriota bacterium]|nr:hypothetical protein [Acidobacteriota bacterium]